MHKIFQPIISGDLKIRATEMTVRRIEFPTLLAYPEKVRVIMTLKIIRVLNP